MPYNKSNLDLVDKPHIKNPWESNGMVFSGNTNHIKDQALEQEHISPELAAAILGLKNTSMPSLSHSKFKTMWTDYDAQEVYLRTKPTCYLILGKPGLGAYTLGEAISKKYNCIHMCPRNIITDEISQGSLTGKCMDFNFKHNTVCTQQTILKILVQKLKSPAIKHRGYVISGFPLVTASENPNCLVKPKHTEEALLTVDEILFDIIYNLKRKKPKPVTQTSLTESTHSDDRNMEEEGALEEEEEEKQEEITEVDAEEQEVVAELPKFFLHTCADVFIKKKIAYFETQQAIALQQLQQLFNLNIKPDFIVYITCPDADVVTKKYHKYINYKNGQSTVEPFLVKVSSELRWPSQYTLSDYENPHNIHIFNPKYNCRPPINFKKKSTDQICNYRDYITTFIEKKIMDFEPRQIIKLDGRTSTFQMMHQITERLLLEHINPVLIPEPLFIEDPPEDLDEFWDMIKSLHDIKSGVLSFKYYASPWLNRCPVELKKRQSVIGKPKFAVRLFKHVYLLSSLNNFVSFCRNPRPFLKLKYLEPTCRIIITGTKSSGKTMTAYCLSWIFDAPVTSYETFLETEKYKKYQMYAKSILSEISATIEDARFLEWENKEMNRLAALKEWSNSVVIALQEYLPLLTKSLLYKKDKIEESLEIKQEEQQDNMDVVNPIEKRDDPIIEDELESELDPISLKNLNSLRSQLSFLPMLDSVDECKTVLKNILSLGYIALLEYAPLELKTETDKPKLPILGDEDVMKAISLYIVNNDLQKEIEPTTEELMTEIIKLISTIDKRSETKLSESHVKYIIDGFPSDMEYWEFLSDAKLLPDYSIAIMENREIEPDLYLHYLNVQNSIKNYGEVMSSVDDPLILSKLQTKQLPNKDVIEKNARIIVHDLINDSLNSLINFDTIPDSSNPRPEEVTSFTESIDKFREDWDSIKIKLEEVSKCYIEIELEEKTDINVLEEVLLKLRKCYFLKSELNEDEDIEVDEEGETSRDLLTYNNPQYLCETNIYCPYTYYNCGVLWEGKPEFSLKYDNKVHYFGKEEYIELFQKDITKYQTYNQPFKKLPKLKICITGCIGSGKTTLSKRIATELGLIHVDILSFLNTHCMPKHYKKVGRSYENPFKDVPIEEEGVMELLMDEENPNMLADILSNETELRRIIHNYFERGIPVLSIIMEKIITKIWNNYPYVNIGFVLDGYPRLPQDIEDMIHWDCIPDLIINLETSAETAIERLGPLMMNQWKTQLKEAKQAHMTVMKNEKEEWMRFITKEVVVKVMIDDILENVVQDLPKPVLSAESLIIDAHPSGSANVHPLLFSAYNKLIEEYPEPVDIREWDKPADERERIDARLESIYDTDFEGIEGIKELLEENKIKLVSIDATKPFYKVFRLALSKVSSLRNRPASFFEQTYIISTDIAELLLSQGHYFLSKFGRLCPVYIKYNPQTILNSYKISRRKGKLFPVIHRAYIYFISSGEHVNKFRSNPLKYVTNDIILTYHPYPLRIGIIGAPKSGKSLLATNLAKRYNLLCISKGIAVRSIITNMYWTELASKMLKRLDNGEFIDTDLIMSAVQTVAIDHRTATYGFVLDGFPSSPYEAMVLSENGLYPNIIFDITSKKSVCLGNSQNEVYENILKYKPPYSFSLMENRFTKWNEEAYKIRNWINDDYQNICSVNGNDSKWQCLQDANNDTKQLMNKIHHYLANVETNIVPAHAMAISNEIFEKKQSTFKNMCPVCLSRNVIKHSSFPSDKTGVVQYKDKLYWICADHFDLVLMYPDYYMSKEINIPEVPAVVKTIKRDLVYENGICMVTYAENLPRQLLEPGTNKFAAAYKSKTYMFCSEGCLNKFLAKPHLYATITVFKDSSWFPRLSLNKLPDLGYLEQTLANILTEACCSVNAIRPKYPGLSFQLSAIIYIALYLKTHNPRLPEGKLEYFKKALKIFETRSKLVLDLGLRMRSMDNPFHTYPECHHATPKNYSLESGDGEISSTFFKPLSITSSPQSSFAIE